MKHLILLFFFFNLISFIILLCGPFLLLFGKQVEKWISRDHQNYHDRYPDKKSLSCVTSFGYLIWRSSFWVSLRIMHRAVTKVKKKKVRNRIKSASHSIMRSIIPKPRSESCSYTNYREAIICVGWRPIWKHELSFRLAQTEGSSAVQLLWDSVVQLQLTSNMELVTSLKCNWNPSFTEVNNKNSCWILKRLGCSS